MYCSKCGAENPDGSKFCSKCGADLGGTAMPAEAPKAEATGGTSLSPNVAGLLCYLATWLTGIIFVLIEKKNTFVRFHAWQSIMTFGVLFVAYLLLPVLLGAIGAATLQPGLIIFAGVLNVIIWILIVGLWIALMILAYQGKMWKVPWAGNWAERQAQKTSS